MTNFSVLANLSKIWDIAYTCEINIFLGVFLGEIFYSFEPQCDIPKKSSMHNVNEITKIANCSKCLCRTIVNVCLCENESILCLFERVWAVFF